MTAPIDDPGFGALGEHIEDFANHTRKALRASQKWRPLLDAAAEWSEGAAPIQQTPADPAVAMRAVDQFARSHRHNRSDLVGAYFAHHHLRIQAQMAQSLLEMQDGDPSQHIARCHQVYAVADDARRRWVACLLDLTVKAAAPELAARDFVAFNVGALIDHEDVDLAIVVRTPQAREAMARCFAVVSRVFLKFASKIQLFLTEQLSTPRVSAMVEEYEELLDTPQRNVVSVMQLLGSQYLCGDKSLAKALDERVIHRYYAGQGSPIAHEGFLRSVSQELRFFLQPNPAPGVLSPKREIYIPSKLATTAVRVIHGVHDPRPSTALRAVAERDPALRETYFNLADAFVQNEVLRALMFLYVFQGEQFDLLDPDIRNASGQVAHLLGLGDSARRTADDRLIGMYTEVRTRALRALATLLSKIDLHLSRVSTFRRLVKHHEELRNEGENLAVRLLEALENYRGSVFWDEVVEVLTTDRDLGDRFVADFKALGEDEAKAVANRYVVAMAEDATSLVELLCLLTQKDRDAAGEVGGGKAGPTAHAFWDQLMALLFRDRKTLERFVQRLDAETSTESLFRLCYAFQPNRTGALADHIEKTLDSNRAARVARALRSMIVLVHHHSRAVGRVARRVLARSPEFIARLNDHRRLRDLSTETVQEAAREPWPKGQVELLGDAFDVVTLGSALIAILEGAPAARDAEFTAAVDQYVRELFKACFREVRDKSPLFSRYRPGSQVAVYATGGYGRGEAFGGDWDYIAMVDEPDRGLTKFFGKVIQRVSAAMTRRGLHPHNRFSDHFNAYVVSVPELKAHLERRTSETFIDEAEVLEARFFLGDPVTARRFNEEVRSLVTETHAEPFIEDVLRELRARRLHPPVGLNLKLAPGGLREIHLLWLAVRVFARLPGPLTPELIGEAAGALPDSRGDLRFLMVANAELRRARELYRLAIAFDDTIDPQQMVNTAKDLAPLRRAGVRGDYQRELGKLLQTASIRVDRVILEIEQKLHQRKQNRAAPKPSPSEST